MVAISATSYATPSAQVMQARAKLDQARREADQAEATAKQLREQADQAEQQAQQGQARVGALRTQVSQADSTYSSQLRSKTAVAASKQVQEFLAPVAEVARNGYSFPSNPLLSSGNLWSAINQKPSTGRLVNQTV